MLRRSRTIESKTPITGNGKPTRIAGFRLDSSLERSSSRQGNPEAAFNGTTPLKTSVNRTDSVPLSGTRPRSLRKKVMSDA
jgi:hypothetical protein